MRSGIMAIDIGQFEAGRSLGFGYPATMWHIILPQALKNVLPALGNEIIVLLKETSISGYIALTDLTHGRQCYPEPDLFRIHAPDCRCSDLPGNRIPAGGRRFQTGKEAAYK